MFPVPELTPIQALRARLERKAEEAEAAMLASQIETLEMLLKEWHRREAN